MIPKNANSTLFQNIFQEIKDHPSNRALSKKGYDPIYTASKTSKIVIIGQAPGIKAQESRIPWNDASGKTLREWLGISSDLFYDESLISLMPMDFYYPGKRTHGDLPPRKEFAPTWHPKLLENMTEIKLILLIGQYAQKYYLSKDQKRNLTDTVKSFRGYLPKYFPLVHPSPLNFRWQAKNPWFKKEVIPYLKKQVKSILKK